MGAKRDNAPPAQAPPPPANHHDRVILRAAWRANATHAAARRIVILGCAGAGKSTLAGRIGGALGAPVICLDAIWRAAWTAVDLAEFRATIAQMHGGETWISDGNFAAATFDLRLPRADLIVWLERPRSLCLWRAIRRVFRHGESHRGRDVVTVLRFIWNFERVNRPRIEALRLAHGPDVRVVRLSSNTRIDRFVAELSRTSSGGLRG